jgi:hypothetical protein
MRNTDLEVEAELEEFITQLSESLEAEDEWEGMAARGSRCTAVGTRVGTLTCSLAERANIENLLSMSIPAATLKAAVESATAGAVSLATRAATALDRSNRSNAVRSTFCESFGVRPEFVPPWRATLRGVVRWKDLGELVAIRLVDVAKILDGGCIDYSCWITAGHCPDCGGVDAARVYSCSDFHGRYVICLGGLFWRRWQSGDTTTTQSTLLHEALHIYFRTTVGDQGRSGNANCYERFAVRLQNLPLHPDTAANCAAGTCVLTPPGS